MAKGTQHQRKWSTQRGWRHRTPTTLAQGRRVVRAKDRYEDHLALAKERQGADYTRRQAAMKALGNKGKRGKR